MMKKVCIGLLLVMGFVPDGIAAPKPNILLILADDLSPLNLGAYGGTIPTPHLDRLADNGVYLQNAWATPMCGPSRAMLMTGCGAQRTGIWHNALNVRPDRKNPHDLAGNHLYISKAIKDAGYATAVAGKPHMIGGNPSAREVGFDQYCLHNLFVKDLPAGSEFDGKLETEASLPGWNNPVASRYWHPCVVQNGKLLDTTDNDFGDEMFADFLVEFFADSNRENRPAFGLFMMALPHTTAGADDLSQRDKVPFPTTPLSGRPGENYDGTWEECIEYIDTLMGRMQKQLKERGLDKNTIIIFTTDNGDQHTLAKMSATEQGARVPVIISGPSKQIKVSGSSDILFSLADLLPTCVAWAGGEVPSTDVIDGINHADFMAGKAPGPRKMLDSYCGTARLVRDADWCLEAVDPLEGFPDGRLYRYNKDGSHTQIVDGQMTERAMVAKKKLMRYLDELPYFDKSLPHIDAALKRYLSAPHRHKQVFYNSEMWYMKMAEERL